MATVVDSFNTAVDAVLSAAAQLTASASHTAELDDAAVVGSQRSIAQARRHLDAVAAKLAGETAVRSSREAGLAGLAQKEGFRTPEALIKSVTGYRSRGGQPSARRRTAERRRAGEYR